MVPEFTDFDEFAHWATAALARIEEKVALLERLTAPRMPKAERSAI